MANKSNDRIKTTLKISNAPICRRCPSRIYQKEDSVVSYGKGAMYPDIMIVLPNTALYNDKIENYLKMVFDDICNLDEQYITYHPKCINDGDIVKDYSEKCDLYLLHEISIKKPKKIIFFGAKIPKELYNTITNKYKIYKFKDLFTIHFGKDTVTSFKENLKQIL